MNNTSNGVHVGRVIYVAGLTLGMMIGLLAGKFHNAETMPPTWMLVAMIVVCAVFSAFVMAKFERGRVE